LDDRKAKQSKAKFWEKDMLGTSCLSYCFLSEQFESLAAKMHIGLHPASFLDPFPSKPKYMQGFF